MIWQTALGPLDLTSRAAIMGILNVTPDSFSDGGTHFSVERAVARGLEMIEEGAAIIDIGGESTRPGAEPVPVDEEMRRTLPVVQALSRRIGKDCFLSIDTSKAAVARAAVSEGAAIINDVTALRGDPDMARAARESSAGLILMHMRGEPRTMQIAPQYKNVAAEVRAFFDQSADTALAADILPERLAFDPGIGFGKTIEHNLALLRSLSKLAPAGRPLVLGVSRKAFLAKVTGAETMPERLWPTLALTAFAREKGVRVLRVHDVRPNVAALRMAEALLPPA